AELVLLLQEAFGLHLALLQRVRDLPALQRVGGDPVLALLERHGISAAPVRDRRTDEQQRRRADEDARRLLPPLLEVRAWRHEHVALVRHPLRGRAPLRIAREPAPKRGDELRARRTLQALQRLLRERLFLALLLRRLDLLPHLAELLVDARRVEEARA